MDTQAVARRILLQRMERFTDPGPSLGSAGRACFRLETGRLRVAYASAQPGRADEVVQDVLRLARKRRMQVQWTVLPHLHGEEEIGPALMRAGFHPTESLLLMAHEGLIAAAPNPAITVQQIHTWQAMWEYEYGSRQCFYDEPYPSDAFVGQRASDRWREIERGWCRYYTSYLDGRQVGGCYVSLYEDIPTIMGVFTLPAARKRGVATALLVRTVAETITPQNDLCCLFVQHGNPAERLYRDLGFVALLDSHTYDWSGAEL